MRPYTAILSRGRSVADVDMRNTKTTIRKQAELLREARQALGVKSNAEAHPTLCAAGGIADAAIGFIGGGTLSHYMGWTWGFAWIGKDRRDCFAELDASDLSLSPAALIEKNLNLRIWESWRLAC